MRLQARPPAHLPGLSHLPKESDLGTGHPQQQLRSSMNGGLPGESPPVCLAARRGSPSVSHARREGQSEHWLLPRSQESGSSSWTVSWPENI